MPYPMESGIEMMAADTAPERSPLKFGSRFFRFIFILPFGPCLRPSAGSIPAPNAHAHGEKEKSVYQFRASFIQALITF
jgi:hypothetical protein